MTPPNLPIFYQQPVPLNKEAHAGWTISPSRNGLRFAASAREVLLTSVEFFDAGRQFPIIFTLAPNARIVPIALMGLEENENLFVTDDGAWLGQYIPAYIRRYPFITTDGSEGQTTVCFDEAFDGFNQEGGAPLFKDGEPTETTQQIQAFLQDYLVQISRTEQFVEALTKRNLLRQIDAQANLNDGRNYALKGMLVVDEQKLAKLPDSDVLDLFHSGMLALIHAHLLSLRNLGVLVDRKSKLDVETP